MSLYKRGGVWWTKLYQDGVPVYKSTKTEDKVEAKRIHDTWAGEIAKGSFLPRADQTRYDEMVEDLLRHYTGKSGGSGPATYQIKWALIEEK